MDETNPMLFDFLVGFGKDNDLEMVDENGNPVEDV
jgi:hypothetical protein